MSKNVEHKNDELYGAINLHATAQSARDAEAMMVRRLMDGFLRMYPVEKLCTLV
jgi:hypothetical protein